MSEQGLHDIATSVSLLNVACGRRGRIDRKQVGCPCQSRSSTVRPDVGREKAARDCRKLFIHRRPLRSTTLHHCTLTETAWALTFSTTSQPFAARPGTAERHPRPHANGATLPSQSTGGFITRTRHFEPIPLAAAGD